MISNNSSLEVHNKFELQLCDVDGNIEQEAYAYNAANSLMYMLQSIGIDGGNVGGPAIMFGHYYYLVLGDGDVSTTPPKETDRYLIHQRFESSIDTYEFKRITPFTKEYQTIEYQSVEHIFPATRDFIANLTEIGLANFNNASSTRQLLSHAALVDAEGNPIVIKKTEYNILKVKCTIYFTPVLTIPSSALNFKFFPAYSSVLGGCCLYFETSPQPFKGCHRFPSASGGNYFYFSPQYVPESSDGIIYDNPMMTKDRAWNSLISTSWRYNQKMSYDNNTLDFSPVFPITQYVDNELISQKYKNFGFAHSIVFPNFGAISLPNENIIPKYTLDVAIGSGDGEKAIFFTSVNELATDEEGNPILKVYFQNSEDGEKSLVNSSSYIFTNFTAKKSPLWNKMLYVERRSTGEQIFPGSYGMNLIAGDGSKTNYDSCWIGYCALTNSTFNITEGVPTATANLSYAERFFAPSYLYDVIYYDERGITLDEGKIGTYGIWYQNNISSWYNPSLILFYKDSLEEEWTNEKMVSIPSSSTNSNEFTVTKFTPITAKYWKIRMDSPAQIGDYIVTQGSNRLNSSSFSANTARDNQIMGLDPNFIILGNSAEYDFSKVGLSFTTPPPAGTIITMEATLDLPYKTPDGSMTFSFQSTLNPPNTGA